MRHGIWCALYAGAHTDPKKHRPEPIDFMPFAERPEVDNKAQVAASFQAFVGSIKTLLKPRKKDT